MGPALQRLLRRPTSIDFLKLLTGQHTTRVAVQHGKSVARKSSGVALSAKEDGVATYSTGRREVMQRDHGGLVPYRPLFSRDSREDDKRSGFGKTACYQPKDPDIAQAPISPPQHLLEEMSRLRFWTSESWARQRLEFESDMGNPDPRRMINQPVHKHDLDLWICLMEYRRNQYGDEGVVIFWDSIFQDGIRLPTVGEKADALWSALLDVDFGVLPSGLLDQVCRYADLLLELHSSKAPILYQQILQYFLVSGSHKEVMYWHHRLYTKYAAGDTDFTQLFQVILDKKGSQRNLMEIYASSQYHDCYDYIVYQLCEKEEYQAAIEWHFLLVQQKDLPTSQAVFGTLLDHLKRYSPRCAAKIVQSLKIAKPTFEVAMTYTPLRLTPKNSIDLVSEVRSKTFHVSEKPYNDSLGARWLATSWITLDTAIKTIDALGVKEIGPLSVQSIALREKDAEKIATRMDQLQDMGISIGRSCYALAVARFARDNKQDLLNLMLESDQHPSELDNQKLQEQLLFQYSHSKQWKEFRLTLELLSFRGHKPQRQKRNLLLRVSLNGDTPATVANIRENIREMIHDDIPVMYDTIVAIKNALLPQRRKGHRPVTRGQVSPAQQLDDCISLLELIAESNLVPIFVWTEIVRRLGMLGHFHALDNVCMKIAKLYASDSLQLRLARVPSQVPTSNPAHPLRQFFNDTLQMAIVEWGFIHALDGRVPSKSDGKVPITVNSGIQLLKELYKDGIWISHESIRHAVLNRLLVYYGPGESNRRYNRAARERLTLSLPEMASSIEYDLGIHKLSERDLHDLVDVYAQQQLENRKVPTSGKE